MNLNFALLSIWNLKRFLFLFRQNEHDTTIKRHENRIQILLETKDKIKDELVHYRNAYSHIDEIFTIEIKNAESLN